MSFSLDPLSVATLKAEARVLREEQARGGAAVSQAAALETVARTHGFRDWNTARASLPDLMAPPAQVGERVGGAYLGQPFVGTVIGVEALPDSQHFRMIVKFDTPVDVVRSESFSALRQRVTASVDVYGNSSARTGDGRPQMQLQRLR